MWEIDYAVRNSGSFSPLQDRKSSTIQELLAFSRQVGLAKLTAWLGSAADKATFCSRYFEEFDVACSDLRSFYCEKVR